jgi:hypothetical protein
MTRNHQRWLTAIALCPRPRLYKIRRAGGYRKAKPVESGEGYNPMCLSIPHLFKEEDMATQEILAVVFISFASWSLLSAILRKDMPCSLGWACSILWCISATWL